MNNNKNQKIFKDINPQNFNAENEDISSQVKALEAIVKTKFGKKSTNPKDCNSFLSSTQLRNLYDKIKQCKRTEDLSMLYPKIIYMAARQTNNKAKNIIMEIAEWINKIEGKEQLQSFKKFMEAIVAFQKYYYSDKN